MKRYPKKEDVTRGNETSKQEKELRAMLKVTRQATLKELNKLVDLKVIVPKGRGRNLHYVLT